MTIFFCYRSLVGILFEVLKFEVMMVPFVESCNDRPLKYSFNILAYLLNFF